MVKSALKSALEKNIPRWVVLFIDIYIVVNTFLLAYFVRFNFEMTFDTSKFIDQIPWVIITALASFLITGSYKGTIRHTSFRDAMNVTLACLMLFGFLSIGVLLNRNFQFFPDLTIPISILVIHFLLNTMVLIMSRHLFKEFYKLLIAGNNNKNLNKRVLIYGAGDAGMLTYSVINDDKDINAVVVGFIDDNQKKSKKNLLGLPVFHAKKINKKFIEDKKIGEIIIAIQNIKPKRLLEISNNLSKLSVAVKIVPPSKNWVDGDFKTKQIKNVRIEDLLGRDPINIDNSALKREFNNKVILITGAAGSIGSEISKQIANYHFNHLILVDQAESDLYNLEQYFKNKNTGKITVIVADVRNLLGWNPYLKITNHNWFFMLRLINMCL